jgi:hypothetical protein
VPRIGNADAVRVQAEQERGSILFEDFRHDGLLNRQEVSGPRFRDQVPCDAISTNISSKSHEGLIRRGG